MDLLVIYIPIVLAVYIITRYLLNRTQNLPPSPFSLPFFGHLYLLKTPLYQTLSKVSNRYGPVVFLRFGSRPILVVSSPSTAEECFSKNDIVFANRPHVIVGEHLGYNVTSITWASYGHHWRNQRRIASLELLSTHRLQALSNIRLEEVKLMISRLFNKRGETVDMRTTFFELTLNIMMRMIAGKRYYGENVEDLAEANRFREIQEETFRLGMSTLADFMPIMRRFGRYKKLEKRLMKLRRDRDEFMQSLIEEEKRKMKTTDYCYSSPQKRKKTMIEVLLKLQEMEPEYYKDEIVKGLMLSLLVAGTETSTNTMEWSLSLLLNHPEVLKKAQAEIEYQVGHERLVDESDITQLPYLQSIIKETLRMYPPAPLLLPHLAASECMVGGFHIPAGTTLFVNAWAIQNDPNVWDEPESFKPERFEEEEEEEQGARNGLRLMPFGSGRRGCPGEGLAMRMVGLVLGSLIQCFYWERPSVEKVDMTEGTGFNLPRARPLLAKCRSHPTVFDFLSKIQTNVV